MLKVAFKTVLLLVLSTAPAWAYIYFTPEALMESFFPGSGAGEDRVESVVFTPDGAQRAAIEAQLGYKLPKPSYTLEIGRGSGAEPALGYALVDNQLGQHEPITVGVLLGPDGAVQQVEVLVYREAYGDGVRAASFRDQFTGLNAASTMRAGKEIRIVSGATISSRALATVVKRAAVLVSAWRAAHPG